MFVVRVGDRAGGARSAAREQAQRRGGEGRGCRYAEGRARAGGEGGGVVTCGVDATVIAKPRERATCWMVWGRPDMEPAPSASGPGLITTAVGVKTMAAPDALDEQRGQDGPWRNCRRSRGQGSDELTVPRSTPVSVSKCEARRQVPKMQRALAVLHNHEEAGRSGAADERHDGRPSAQRQYHCENEGQDRPGDSAVWMKP